MTDRETTDIVARLRGYPLDEWEGGVADDIEAAIIEIERLREGLAGMVMWFGKYPEFVPHPDRMEKCMSAIRRAKEVLADE